MIEQEKHRCSTHIERKMTIEANRWKYFDGRYQTWVKRSTNKINAKYESTSKQQSNEPPTEKQLHTSKQKCIRPQMHTVKFNFSRNGIGLEGTHPQVGKNYTCRCLQRLRVRSVKKLNWRADATGKGKNTQINQHDWKQPSKPCYTGYSIFRRVIFERKLWLKENDL